MAIQHATGQTPGYVTEADAARARLPGLTTLVGAALSLGLILGGAVWSYQLIMRDVSGVPVVRAMTVPMRELPAEPGGTAADHMGLAVNSVAAEGVAAPTPDALTLAPAPVDLVDEDAPTAALANPAPVAPEQRVQASVAAMVADLTREANPLAALPDAPQVAALDADTSLDTGPESSPQAAPTLRPRERPQALSRVKAAPIEAAVTAAVLAVDPETIAPGTRLAQLGAFETPEIAAREWDRLGARFGDYLAGKSRVIQEAQSGGRTFFRLRAHGFDDLDAARRFCAALVAERAECIPVVTR